MPSRSILCVGYGRACLPTGPADDHRASTWHIEYEVHPGHSCRSQGRIVLGFGDGCPRPRFVFFLGGGDLITGADIAYAAHRETNLKILFIRTRGAYEIQISVDASRVDADVLAAVPVLGDVPVEEGHLSRRRQIESRLSQISRGGTSALAGTQPITLPKNIEVSELMTYGGFGRHRDHCGTAIDGKRMLKPCFPCGRNVHFQCHRKRIGPRNQNAPVGCRFTTQVRFTGQDSRP